MVQLLAEDPNPSDSFLPRTNKRLDHAEGVSTGFMVESDRVLSKGYRHEGPGVCLSGGRRKPRNTTTR